MSFYFGKVPDEYLRSLKESGRDPMRAIASESLRRLHAPAIIDIFMKLKIMGYKNGELSGEVNDFLKSKSGRSLDESARISLELFISGSLLSK